MNATPRTLRRPTGKPNCVNSMVARTHPAFIEPIAVDGDAARLVARVKRVVAGMKGARLVEEDGTYLRFEFTTSLMRYVDDVEFVVDPTAGVLHLGSASRVGYHDLWMNRRRMEQFRRLWTRG